MTKKTNAKAMTAIRAEAGRRDPTAEISRKLRALYDSVREEAIPDRFLDLLEKLDQAEKAEGGGRTE